MESNHNTKTGKGNVVNMIIKYVYYSSGHAHQHQIKKKSVKRYGPGKRIPHIRLRVRWEDERQEPVRADLTIALTGTLEPVSFLFECDPQLYTPSMYCIVHNTLLVHNLIHLCVIVKLSCLTCLRDLLVCPTQLYSYC